MGGGGGLSGAGWRVRCTFGSSSVFGVSCWVCFGVGKREWDSVGVSLIWCRGQVSAVRHLARRDRHLNLADCARVCKLCVCVSVCLARAGCHLTRAVVYYPASLTMKA